MNYTHVDASHPVLLLVVLYYWSVELLDSTPACSFFFAFLVVSSSFYIHFMLGYSLGYQCINARA